MNPTLSRSAGTRRAKWAIGCSNPVSAVACGIGIPIRKASWSGTCRGALKEGRGVVQWTEHGQLIDRFEGTYRDGRREGAGRYSWNATTWFEGNYSNDIPDGQGTVSLDGATLSGVWHKGCLASEDKVVAIGVPRASCESRPQETANLK